MTMWTQAKMDRFMNAEAKVFGSFLTPDYYLDATSYFKWLGQDMAEWLADEETKEEALEICGGLAKALRIVEGKTLVPPELTCQLLDWSIYAVVDKLMEERARLTPKIEAQV